MLIYFPLEEIVKKEDEKEELEEKKEIIDKIWKKMEKVRESLSSSGRATNVEKAECQSFITKCKSNIILFSIFLVLIPDQ